MLALSRSIDALNTWVGALAKWLILFTTLVSAGNAIVRKLFSTSSNALLEIQWYLFAGVFMLAAGYVFLKNAHVRIDVLSSKWSAKTRNWVDVIGILVILFPTCLFCLYLGWNFFWQAFVSGETSQNAGGLIRWPAYALIPAGFFLLLLQGVSELIKRIAFLQGKGPDALGDPDDAAKEAEAISANMRKETEQ